MKRLNIIFLLLLPGLLFYIGMLLKSETGFYHLYSSDPVYAYLFDGLNICNFSSPFLVFGPGTPLSLLYAIIMEIVHLFRHQDSLITDVMKNPDVYLSAVNITIIAIQSIALFMLGFFIYKASKSVFTGVFFQLIPFVSWIIMDIMRPILVESLIVISIFFLIIFVYKYIKYQDNESKLLDKYLVCFSILTGFMVATKLMYLPIVIIPLLLLPGYKKKGLYVVFSIITFSILAFPIFKNWVEFRSYYIDNFLHVGLYGQGSKTIIELNAYIHNLKSIFISDHLFLKTYSIIIMGSILYYLPFLKVREKNDKTYKALLGIALVMTITILLVSKQFKFYYMTSALLLSIPGLYFVFSIYTRKSSIKVRTIIAIPAVLILSYFVYHEIKMRVDWHAGNMVKKENYLYTMKYIEENYSKDQPTLLIPDYYGAPYTAYGCFYGMGWCRGEIKKKYAEELKKLYPNIYSFHTWNNLFLHWNKSYPYIDLLKKYNDIILFSGDKELEQSLSGKLNGLNRQFDTKVSKIISFESTGETIYKVSYDSTLKLQPQSYYFDAEFLDTTQQYFVNGEGLKCGNGNTRSSDFARSGGYSSKLSKEAPYGMTSFLSEVGKDKHFRISVWRYNNENDKAGLVVSTIDSDKYHQFFSQPSEEEKQWQKIEIDFVVPETIHMQDLKIYCWNGNTALPAYFDDLLIEKVVQ